MSESPTPRSAALFERAVKVLPDGNSRTTIMRDPHPLYVAEGRGARVKDVDGNELIDFNNNYTSLIHGHAHPVVNAAVAAQLARGSAFAFATEVEVAHAELLCARAPSFEKIRFCNSGTEAVMNALKAARAHTGRPKIAKCEGAYHGAYDYAEVSLDSGPDDWGNDPNAVATSAGTPEAVLADTVVIPFNQRQAAERILAAQAGELAAVLVDPVSSRIGMVAPDADFLAMLAEFCAANGVVLIFDEVLAFRQGFGGAQGRLGVDPDLTALGKIIGGGLPVGAVAGKAEVMAVFEARGGKAPLPHGGTFNANPLSMAAGLACMTLFDEAAVDGLNGLGDSARQHLRAAIGAAGAEAQVTGDGSLFRLHLHGRPLDGYRTAYSTADERARMARLFEYLLAAGIYLSPYGMGCLSTAMEESDIARLGEAMEAGLRAVMRD